MRNINRVVLICGLTRDPELRQTPSGKAVVTLRVGFATGRLIDGAWQEKRNYIDVEVWGSQAENAARHLSRGRQVCVDGRLELSEYEARDGSKRRVHRVVADNVQYLPQAAGGVGGSEREGAQAADVAAPAQTDHDDEIPF